MTIPVLPEGRYADVGDGLKIHYHEAGAGPVVVFVHGSGPGASGYSNFKQNFLAFADAGFRVLVPDTLGYGLSSKPDDIEYGFDFLIEKLVRFLDEVGATEVALVGNSLGGALCIGLTLAHPERVTRLILMAPGGLEERETYMGMRGIRSMLKSIYGPDGITREGMRKVFGLQLFEGEVDEDTIEERYQIALTQPRAVFETVGVPNLSSRLGELSCPVFALWGVDDQFCPVSGAMTIAQSVKNCRVLMLSQCGHWVMVERTGLFNRLAVEWLCEV